MMLRCEKQVLYLGEELNLKLELKLELEEAVDGRTEGWIDGCSGDGIINWCLGS